MSSVHATSNSLSGLSELCLTFNRVEKNVTLDELAQRIGAANPDKFLIPYEVSRMSKIVKELESKGKAIKDGDKSDSHS